MLWMWLCLQRPWQSAYGFINKNFTNDGVGELLGIACPLVPPNTDQAQEWSQIWFECDHVFTAHGKPHTVLSVRTCDTLQSAELNDRDTALVNLGVAFLLVPPNAAKHRPSPRVQSRNGLNVTVFALSLAIRMGCYHFELQQKCLGVPRQNGSTVNVPSLLMLTSPGN